jgi:uncharacterized membrane protein YgaE (UPF0421/DUF939 family)
MTGEPTELDQLQLQQRIDMRFEAEHAIQKYGEGKHHWEARYRESARLANYVITLLDEAEQVCTVANELTKQIEKIIEQRAKMADLLRDVIKEVGEVTGRDCIRGYVDTRMSLQTIEEIQEVIK